MKKTFVVLLAGVILTGCTLGNYDNSPVSDNDKKDSTTSSGSRVDMSGQGLATMPTSVFNQSGVTDFNVSGNKLTGALPSEIGKWKKLETLNVSNNLMTGIPAEIGQLLSLKELDYGNNQIDTMPNEIANLANLIKLSLANNLYREVPATLLQLPRLNSLDLSMNRLAKLPDNLSGWKNLTTLNITGNPLPTTEVERAKNALPNTEVKF